jgi:DNA-binding beta-propeller fold protein YncE/DNA-directed RNA polymerase subunit RPC12/RpoP
MSETASLEPELFRCPTCGASLPIPEARSVRCEYCGNNVLVPPEFRPVKHRRKEAAREATPQDTTRTLFELMGRRAWARQRITGGVIVAIIVFIVISILGLIGSKTFRIFPTDNPIDQEINATATWMIEKFMSVLATQVPTTDTPTPFPPIKVLLKFGGEGSGAGKFDDPRHVALDPDNNIFVADYSDGRVQKFDPSGKFLQLIHIEPDSNQRTTIRDMATDYSGNLYLVRGGDLLVYSTADGKLLNSIPGKFPELHYDKLSIDPANNLYAISEWADFTDLLKLDAEGKILWMKSNFLESAIKNNSSAYVEQMAVDGLGKILVLDGFSNQIYKFDTQGDFVDRFGSKGFGPQQLNNVSAMTVDGSGNAFLVDTNNWYTIKVFDTGGNFLGGFSWPRDLSSPRDIVFDLQGNLYTVTNQAEVARMTLDMGKLEN